MLSLLMLLFAVPASFGNAVFDLDGNTFDNYIHDKDVMLVDFFAPWCQHCQRLAPELENAANQFATTKNNYVFAKVDCIQPQNVELCKKFNVQGYPALKLFKYGTYTGDYIGDRTADDLVNYMESVTETTQQRAPLTTHPASFASLLGASPQAYVNPQQPQLHPMAPQPYGMPQAQPNFGTFFNRPEAGPNPSPMQSFYNPPNSNPANAAYASQQPTVETQAPKAPLHLGASPDSLAGKFGGNMLALEILRSKLKMIAAYKNWQKRLKEYKGKMSEAAKLNPLNQNKLAAAKNTIHKPYPAQQKAAYVKPHIKRNHYQVEKYPRTFPQPEYYQPGKYQNLQYGDRRTSVYRMKTWQQKRAKQIANYKKKLAAYHAKQYATYKSYYINKPQQQQLQDYGRSDITRPQTPQQDIEPTIVQPQVAQPASAAYVQPQPQAPIAVDSQPQVQTQAAFAQPQPQDADVNPQPQVQTQAAFAQPQPQDADVNLQPQVQTQGAFEQHQPQAPVTTDTQSQIQTQAAYAETQPQTAVQPEVQAASQPEVQAAAQPEIQTAATESQSPTDDSQPQAADQTQSQTPIAQPEAQESQTPIAQPEAQATDDEPKGQATNDVPKAESKQQSTNGNDLSMSDLKHDIENAIHDALKNSVSNSVTKPPVKAEPKVQTKVLDISGSGSSSGSMSGSGSTSTNVVSGGSFADASGSGNISGSGSGEPVSKSNDKSTGEA